ncbi:MAG: CTP synthase [candidate division WOR-3 bacterium]
MAKFLFVTGGVVSSLGKGIATSSIGLLLKKRGLRVTLQKFDPYINVDPGTMNPYQHGEVFVTEDGAETDLDLGHYERFIDEDLSQDNNLTTGQIYSSVIDKERHGEFLGGTIQVVPHITGEIKQRIRKLADHADVVITEIGGTVGDIESLPFLEAARQMHLEEGRENVMYVHLTLVPFISGAQEFKTKPTQHSVKELLSIGIQPDVIMCRAAAPLPQEAKDKIAMFCNVDKKAVIEALDVRNIYEIPLVYQRQGLDQLIVDHFGLKCRRADLEAWTKFVDTANRPHESLEIALVGKYMTVHDSYKSVTEAIFHAAVANQVEARVRWVESDGLDAETCPDRLRGVSGVVVPGGFGARGMEGKIAVCEYCRRTKLPYLGLCVGLQCAVVEFARNVCGLKGADSTEFNPQTRYPVIFMMPKQRGVKGKGHNMRLGRYPTELRPGTLAATCYGLGTKGGQVWGRHRHRFEVNPKYLSALEGKGMIASGMSPDRKLVEIVELRDHPFFVATQFHPEFKSRPLRPHPLFLGLLRHARESARTRTGTG